MSKKWSKRAGIILPCEQCILYIYIYIYTHCILYIVYTCRYYIYCLCVIFTAAYRRYSTHKNAVLWFHNDLLGTDPELRIFRVPDTDWDPYPTHFI